MDDIENFPTSEVGKRMLKSVSPIYENSYVAKWLYQVMGLEMDEAWEYFKELQNQGFPELATWGIRYWEQKYGIRSDNKLILAERRNQVIYRRTNKAPMNPVKLASLIQQATGVECEIEEDVEPYTFGLTILSLPGSVSEDQVKNLVNKLKPAHISFTFVYGQHTTASLYYGGVISFGKIFTMEQVN